MDSTETIDVDRTDPHYRAWLGEAVRKVQADANRSADTHLLRFPLPERWGIDLYLKDESTHITGSLKHRLARSLFLYGLCNGWIRPGKPVIEASSGSTAVSEAYFASLIGVPFIAVMPRTTSREKCRLIEFHGGQCHFVDDPRTMYAESAALATATGGHYMDQFTYAERATDWRGNNNIAESIYQQLRLERYPEPSWIVATAGTGGTSATIGRYVRYMQHRTLVCVADPDNSCFFDGWVSGDADACVERSSRIEGIGRPRMEPSFVPGAIDRMMKVPDAASVAAVRALEAAIGRKAGGSTGTGLWSALRIVAEMVAAQRTGSVVTLLCDPGDRYLDKYYSDAWLAEQGLDIAPYAATLDRFLAEGVWR
ncbi:PLP-dependent cysteine synthase family protein [Streptomyces sp. AC563]|uniref:PLP-dependent cysteine synthase family protein n=1 Tax=Streptomyces buecherae TaxID=2763006 RepID=UPI00164E3FE1|nr:PLP-dependent cysteine synthase family protein [Streptomyces buecherae]MBC3986523.1 PLP-dependent cysteine synthase family protein [Streptomyces buecherae]MBC3987683.1 PLP-dependent cysteine synthase family protein [Streptomyces buecherae]QNJ38934.1 PLP-dependent cysteine synthase family protein [Streptomyces buecherae]